MVVYTSNDPTGRTIGQIVKANLNAIGIDAQVKEFEFTVLYSKAGRRGEPFDIMVIGWFADYPDPFDFINVLLSGKTIRASNNQNFAYWNKPLYNQRMEQASRLFGDARAAAYVKLDADLTREAPLHRDRQQHHPRVRLGTDRLPRPLRTCRRAQPPDALPESVGD